jgi:hypothetical protein
LWPENDRVLLEELMVSWLATLAPSLAETSSAGLELLAGVPSSKGRGTSGGDVHRIRAKFTPADKWEKDERRGGEDSSHILRQNAEYATQVYQLVLFTF